MQGLYFLLPVFITIFLSFLVVRAAAIALMLTGLDRKRAVFQALSSFTGTGFTTKEAEMVINHPARRRIVSWLMILGNAGLITVIVAGTSSLVTSKGVTLPIDAVLLVLGIFIVYKLVSHKEFVRKFEQYIENRLIKSPAFIEEAAVEDLLHLMEGYGLVKAIIAGDSPLIGKPLSGCELYGQKVLVLGIERAEEWVPVPDASVEIKEGDRIVVYGDMHILKDIFKG